MTEGSDIFQLACLLAYLSVFALRSLVLRLRTGVNPFKLGSGTKLWRRTMELLFVPFFIAWALEALLAAARSPFRLFGPASRLDLVDAAWARAAGDFLTLLALALFAGALLSFKNSWRVGIDRERPGELATGGLFACSRNPVFLSIDLLFVGIFLADGTLSLFVFALVVAVGMHAQILEEERHLEAAYGRAYLDYASRVGRYLGRRSLSTRRRTATDPIRKEADLGPIR